MTLAGRSSASAKRENWAGASSKCFWSARAISAALHALCTMNRVTLSPRFSAPSRISRSSSADARKLILRDLAVERFLTAVAIASSTRTYNVRTRINATSVVRSCQLSCAIAVPGDASHYAPTRDFSILLSRRFRAGCGLRKSLNQNGVARKSATIAVKLWISISGFESLGGSQSLQSLTRSANRAALMQSAPLDLSIGATETRIQVRRSFSTRFAR